MVRVDGELNIEYKSKLQAYIHSEHNENNRNKTGRQVRSGIGGSCLKVKPGGGD